MGRQLYPNEVVTDIPADTAERVQLTVMRELMAWCQNCCKGEFTVTTTHRDGIAGTRLAVYFEKRADALRFQAAFVDEPTSDRS